MKAKFFRFLSLVAQGMNAAFQQQFVLMFVLILTLTVWIVWRKYGKKRSSRKSVYKVVSADLKRREKEREKAAREAERAQAKRHREAERARKAEAERQQAEADKVFLVEQIDKLYTMLWDADTDLKTARETCQHDNEMNKHGAIIRERDAQKHRAERERLEKKVMQLERNIHSYETKLNKAQQIARN